MTHLDKVLYPGAEFTKAHVIDYYIKISKWLLPHFARRPVTMLRFPDGVHGKAFYEKDAPKYTPAWVDTTEVPRQSGGKPIRYICIDDLSQSTHRSAALRNEKEELARKARNIQSAATVPIDQAIDMMRLINESSQRVVPGTTRRRAAQVPRDGCRKGHLAGP